MPKGVGSGALPGAILSLLTPLISRRLPEQNEANPPRAPNPAKQCQTLPKRAASFPAKTNPPPPYFSVIT
jgi:hypothetical protein